MKARPARLLLDTHALLWWLASKTRANPMPKATRALIDAADDRYVSTVTCWEIATLVAKRRVTLDRRLKQWVADLASAGVEVVPLDAAAAIMSLDLDLGGFHPDPADRMLYATAHGLGATFVTKDERIRTFAAAPATPPHLRVDCRWPR